MDLARQVTRRFLAREGQYFQEGDIVLFGKYKNHRGKIVNFGKDKWGNPTVEVEPIPKGRKQNKVFGLFKIWRADVKEKALAEQAKANGELTARVLSRFAGLQGIPIEPSLASRVRGRFRMGNALRTANVAGAIPLPPELQDHPALTEGFSDIYPNPSEIGYIGWIEDEPGTWIAWVAPSGEAVLYTKREPSGGVIGVPYSFRRDDLAKAPTLTIPNPALRGL